MHISSNCKSHCRSSPACSRSPSCRVQAPHIGDPVIISIISVIQKGRLGDQSHGRGMRLAAEFATLPWPQNHVDHVEPTVPRFLFVEELHRRKPSGSWSH